MSQPDLQHAIDALRYIPSGDRDTWIRCGMAMRAGFGEAGFEAWDQWSQTASNYKARDARAAWRSFRPGKVTLGTLWFLAQQNGWQRPQGNQVREDPAALRRAREARRQQEQVERRKLREEANAAAARVLKLMPTCEMKPHPYLEAKGFPEHPGMVDPNGRLVLPIYNAQGKVRSAQYITADGAKKFEWLGQVGGNFHRIGSTTSREVWACEGFATGMSVLTALRKRSIRVLVYVTFASQNLKRVGKELAKSGRADRIFTVADHDYWHCRNKHRWDGADYERICPQCGAVGTMAAGMAAALEVGVPWWQPPAPGTDANDFHQAHGLDALANALRDFRNLHPIGNTGV